MKIYSINGVSNYSNKIPAVKNTVKPDYILQTNNNNAQNVSFGKGNTLKWLSGAGIIALSFVCPEAVAVAAFTFFSGLAAYKLTDKVTDPKEQETIAENGKNIMEDIIRDSYPY